LKKKGGGGGEKRNKACPAGRGVDEASPLFAGRGGGEEMA